MSALKVRILVVLLLSLGIHSIIADDSFDFSIKSLDNVLKTLTEVTEPKNIKCQSPWRPYVQENPFMDELYPIEGKSEEKIFSGRELIDHLKKRFSLASAEGTEDEVRCSVDFEEKDGEILVNMKNGPASIKKWPVSKDVLVSAPLTTIEQITIYPDREYVISTSKSKKVFDMKDLEKVYPNHIVVVDRIKTKAGSHLFFSMTSPNMLGHHIFQYDFFSCYFKAALY